MSDIKDAVSQETDMRDDVTNVSRRPGKGRFSISLSPRSIKAFNDLKAMTDADTDSEVFRNALRLHHSLLLASAAGDQLFLRRKENGEMIAVFLPTEGVGLGGTDDADTLSRPAAKVGTGGRSPNGPGS